MDAVLNQHQGGVLWNGSAFNHNQSGPRWPVEAGSMRLGGPSSATFEHTAFASQRNLDGRASTLDDLQLVNLGCQQQIDRSDCGSLRIPDIRHAAERGVHAEQK